MIIAAPMNEWELQDLMYTAQAIELTQPFAIRYPKGDAFHDDWEKEWKLIPIGKAEKLHAGQVVGIATIGTPGMDVLSLYEKLEKAGISFTHYNMRFLKPIDKDALWDLCSQHKVVITIEDGVVDGGLGSSVAEFIAEMELPTKLVRLGVHDKFVEHGAVPILKMVLGYDANGIFYVILNEFSSVSQTIKT